MPKVTDYPRGSLKNSLELADAIEGFGGRCSEEMAADALNRKISGAFHALVGAAGKYDLVSKKSGQLETSPLYRSIKLAYDEIEANLKKAEAFLSPPLFSAIYEQFRDRALPVGHFEKLLIREFDVPNNIASRVAGYFLEGAKQCALLGEGNKLIGISELGDKEANKETEDDEIAADRQRESQAQNVSTARSGVEKSNQNHYTIKILGPGTNFSFDINEMDDLLIVQAIIKKIEKTFMESE